MGKGVLKAVSNVKDKIAPALVAKGLSVSQQTDVDNFCIQLDGTENKGFFTLNINDKRTNISKGNLGANAILGVSLAVCKAGAVQKGVPLYKYIAELAGNVKSKVTYLLKDPIKFVFSSSCRCPRST